MSTMPERMSAGAAIDQLKLALTGNVWYIDGGWQTLVDGLREPGRGKWGAEFRTEHRVTSVRGNDDGAIVHASGRGDTTKPRGRCGRCAQDGLRLARYAPEAPLARWAAEQRARQGGVP